jgi:hypothetical protein
MRLAYACVQSEGDLRGCPGSFVCGTSIYTVEGAIAEGAYKELFENTAAVANVSDELG